ncbi:hypothetical protein TGUWTKB_4920 [Candidatus Tachikawaea gelatinosa]|uniref:Uncharacterized protein n=1 Tax=Candidatus Tachikawaea gelatinosa TaxID=1410383 RepID=A0A090AJT2_9ENTR|nr:hypothetical protein TGUWTKB_4920 [Candidatus Tachikawaea gelatinosa]
MTTIINKFLEGSLVSLYYLSITLEKEIKLLNMFLKNTSLKKELS